MTKYFKTDGGALIKVENHQASFMSPTGDWVRNDDLLGKVMGFGGDCDADPIDATEAAQIAEHKGGKL